MKRVKTSFLLNVERKHRECTNADCKARDIEEAAAWISLQLTETYKDGSENHFE
jgi:hypothetical protein